MLRVKTGGAAVAVEVWALPPAGLAAILLKEPPGLSIGKVKLIDGAEGGQIGGAVPRHADGAGHAREWRLRIVPRALAQRGGVGALHHHVVRVDVRDLQPPDRLAVVHVPAHRACEERDPLLVGAQLREHTSLGGRQRRPVELVQVAAELPLADLAVERSDRLLPDHRQHGVEHQQNACGDQNGRQSA